MLYKRILGASPLTSTSYLHAIKIFYWIAHSVQKNGKKKRLLQYLLSFRSPTDEISNLFQVPLNRVLVISLIRIDSSFFLVSNRYVISH